MRAPAFLLLAALLLPLLAPGAQAGRVWSAEAELRVVDAQKVVETRTVTFDGTFYTDQWDVTIPPNATFRGASDARGALTARASGDSVLVTTRGAGHASYSFQVVFDHLPRREGPFVGFTARVEGDRDSPTTVKVALPGGWSLAGWIAGEGTQRGDDGAFRRTGPQYVDLLALPAGNADPGPDPRVEGRPVLREASAHVGPSGTRLDTTIVYDTDVYSPNWRLPVPEGAQILGASTPFGPLAVRVEAGHALFQTPYKVGYHLGARAFTVSYALPAADPFGGPYRRVNLSIPAAGDDPVSLQVELDATLTHVGDEVVGGRREGTLRYAGTGPLLAQVAFLPPPGPEEVRFTTDAYVVHAPRSQEAAARATALNATQLLPEALGFLGGDALARPFFVAYTDAPVFDWEAGFYMDGLDAISIRASDLAPAAGGEVRLVPVSTLLHETAHGLVDRLLRESPAELSLLHEGLARLAETRIEPHFADQVVSCQQVERATRCTRQSARPEPEDLQAFLASASQFPAAWSTASAPADQRGFLYDHSGLVFHAFERTAGPDALRHALAELALTPFEDDPAKDAETLVGILLSWAPGLTREQLLHPGRQVAHLSAGAFRACMGELLPPAYPFEREERAPADGCGWPSVGTREPPPPVAPTPATPPPPSPTPPAASPTPASPTPSTPAPASPTPATPTAATPTSSPPPPPTHADPPPGPGQQDPVPVTRAGAPPEDTAPTPGPAVLLVVAALGLAALWRRR